MINSYPRVIVLFSMVRFFKIYLSVIYVIVLLYSFWCENNDFFIRCNYLSLSFNSKRSLQCLKNKISECHLFLSVIVFFFFTFTVMYLFIYLSLYTQKHKSIIEKKLES